MCGHCRHRIQVLWSQVKLSLGILVFQDIVFTDKRHGRMLKDVDC